MQPHDRGAFAKLLTEVHAYYRVDLSETVIGLFWDALARWDFADVRQAFSIHLQDPDRGQWCPRIADINRLLEGSTQTQSMRAWVKVEQALRCVGSYQSVVFDDPIIHAVISDMGGWVALCQTKLEDLPFRARDFERTYAAYRTHRERPPHPARLVGIAEGENAMRNLPIARPVLIGEPLAALRVLEGGIDDKTLRVTEASDATLAALQRIGHEGSR
jgi:hypothetical protein